MKIAFVSAAQSIHTVKWVNALAERGHEVRLYSLPNHENKQKNIDPRVRIIYLKRAGFPGYFLNARQMRRELALFRPEVVNAHYASGYGTLARLCKAHPLLLSVWGSDVYEFPAKSFLHKSLVAGNLKKADAVASTSNVMADQVRRVFQYDKPIFITPFGVDCNLFSPRKTEKTGFRVGIVKALEDCYGIEYLIRAFALAVKKLPEELEASLVIYGKGSRRDELQKLIDSLGLTAKATLCGAVPNTEVPEIISKIDVFCLPSVAESFGVSAVEAMACCVPVVATDVDGFREVVDDGVTGYLVPARDPQAMADRICELARDPELRDQFGQNGRERVLALYDFQKNVDAMERYYQRTIELAAKR